MSKSIILLTESTSTEVIEYVTERILKVAPIHDRLIHEEKPLALWNYTNVLLRFLF